MDHLELVEEVVKLCGLTRDSNESVKLGVAVGAGMDLYAAALRQRRRPSFNIVKAVTALRAYGYADQAIIFAIRQLENVQLISLSPTDLTQARLNLGGSDHGRHTVLSNLTGVQHQHVTYSKIRNGALKQVRDWCAYF